MTHPEIEKTSRWLASKAQARRNRTRATELQGLVAASGLPRSEICERLELSKRMLELYLTEQQPIRASVILAMRWIAQETRRSS